MESPLLADATVSRQGSGLAVHHGDDHGLIVSFYMEAELQRAESDKQGRPIYKDVPYIHIRFPGDKTRDVKRRADIKGRRGTPDPQRFPRQWQAFENQQAEVHEGTPLEEWGPMSRSLALTYKGLNIYTVEQLASVSDAVLGQMGHGAREMRDKAQAWMKAAGDDAEVMALQKKNAQLEDDVEMLKQQIAELGGAKKKRKKKAA